MYKRTQWGWLMLVLMLTGAGFMSAFAFVNGQPALWALCGLFILLGICLSTLTVEVSNEAVRYFYGPKVFRWSIPTREIASVEVARSIPLEGWGIRVTSEGMLYNITGDKAVRIHLRSGNSLRVGTDEPVRLAEAIARSISPTQ
jgi:hypothetical protein